jgi:tetratricopeptide (TPR) repeat protein
VARGLVVLFAVVLALPRVGRAEERDDQARARHAAGVAAFEAGRFVEAAAAFEEAWALSARPALLYNIARAYDGANQLMKARLAYERYLASPAASDEEEALRIARRLRTLEADLAHLKVEGPAGADVLIDGEVRGTLAPAAAFELDPGAHRVEVRRSGLGSMSGELRLRPGERRTFDARALAVAAVPAPRRSLARAWWLWTTVGLLAAGAAVAGGVLGDRTVREANQVGSALPEWQ